ncbi:hypothetical protein PanWU01x14_320750 [Parasponia andersonii]|uniref:Uncharacterized protein n=1 Tax=Parasponia andersonii TaxID=3476 RepID=A0A2P5ALE3_PARAD|nr:hypothetical protein PanWU01x14_320750 [Parasponia andersonii]
MSEHKVLLQLNCCSGLGASCPDSEFAVGNMSEHEVLWSLNFCSGPGTLSPDIEIAPGTGATASAPPVDALVGGAHHLYLCLVNVGARLFATVDELADRPQHGFLDFLLLVEMFAAGLMSQ